jgi:hypothetical protein
MLSINQRRDVRGMLAWQVGQEACQGGRCQLNEKSHRIGKTLASFYDQTFVISVVLRPGESRRARAISSNLAMRHSVDNAHKTPSHSGSVDVFRLRLSAKTDRRVGQNLQGDPEKTRHGVQGHRTSAIDALGTLQSCRPSGVERLLRMKTAICEAFPSTVASLEACASMRMEPAWDRPRTCVRTQELSSGGPHCCASAG